MWRRCGSGAAAAEGRRHGPLAGAIGMLYWHRGRQGRAVRRRGQEGDGRQANTTLARTAMARTPSGPGRRAGPPAAPESWTWRCRHPPPETEGTSVPGGWQHDAHCADAATGAFVRKQLRRDVPWNSGTGLAVTSWHEKQQRTRGRSRHPIFSRLEFRDLNRSRPLKANQLPFTGVEPPSLSIRDPPPFVVSALGGTASGAIRVSGEMLARRASAAHRATGRRLPPPRAEWCRRADAPTIDERFPVSGFRVGESAVPCPICDTHDRQAALARRRTVRPTGRPQPGMAIASCIGQHNEPHEGEAFHPPPQIPPNEIASDLNLNQSQPKSPTKQGYSHNVPPHVRNLPPIAPLAETPGALASPGWQKRVRDFEGIGACAHWRCLSPWRHIGLTVYRLTR